MNNPFQELIGIISCGGQSSRMGIDKSLLKYFDKPQRYHIYDLLKSLCKSVYISCNPEQACTVHDGYNYIIDKEEYKSRGPVSGLMSVFINHPEQSILFIGCDYPFLTKVSIQKLIEKRNNKSSSICYYNPEQNVFEPLIAIYENSCLKKILKEFNNNQYSLREFLENSAPIAITPENIETIKSIDTMNAYKAAINQLNRQASFPVKKINIIFSKNN